MGECCKYEKDGTPKKAFAGQSTQRNPHNRNAPHKRSTSYAQLSAKIAKLEKSNKKLKRANKKAIETVTLTTPMHREVMSPVTLGN